MKKLIIVAMSLLALTSCETEKDDVTPSNGGGKGNVPVQAAGKWLHGTFAMASYWAYDGSYQGNPFSQSVAFSFTLDGNYEMFYAGQTNNFGCINDAFSYFKGYVVFTDSTFTVHPQQGRYRGYYYCSPQNNFDRPAASTELKVQTYYYTFETDSNGKRQMVVRYDPADQYPSYFAETTW